MKKFMILASVVAIVVAALALPALAQDLSPFRGGDQDQRSFDKQFDKWQDIAEKRDYTDSEAFNFYLDRLGQFYGFDNDRWNDDDNDQDHWWDNDRNDNDRGGWWNDDRRDDHRNNNNNNNNNDNDEVVPAVSQSFDQQAQSGDVSQSFNVSNTGDNSNQCAGIQGVANTGNAQNQISVVQNGSEADDFSFEDSGASIEVSPSNSTSCDQEVNQAATAYYGW